MHLLTDAECRNSFEMTVIGGNCVVGATHRSKHKDRGSRLLSWHDGSLWRIAVTPNGSLIIKLNVVRAKIALEHYSLDRKQMQFCIFPLLSLSNTKGRMKKHRSRTLWYVRACCSCYSDGDIISNPRFLLIAMLGNQNIHFRFHEKEETTWHQKRFIMATPTMLCAVIHRKAACYYSGRRMGRKRRCTNDGKESEPKPKILKSADADSLSWQKCNTTNEWMSN